MSVKAILTDQQRSYTKAEEDALLAQKQDTLTFDNEPTSESSNPVKSSGIKTSIDNVINGVTPVALAENLTSDSAQSSADTFIERTTGGTASLSDGDGWVQIVRGSHIHTGYVPSDVDMTVTPVLHTLTGTIDQATFFAAVGDDSGTKTFTYTTNWDYNPVTYGITLTGTPLAGDQIVVTYDTTSAVSMTVNSPGDDITATIDEEDFLAQVSGSSGTVTFTYTDSWDTDPATYGITVTGTPAENDSISVTYLITHIASMTVLPIYHSISAEIDEDTFLSEMSNASGYMEFTYTTNWDYNPVTYGITVTGSPVSGDKIRVDYVKETRGTITQSNPQSFKSSGWNLYNHTNGYARVLKYSETYGFGIAGTYTSLAFSPTISGTQTAVTVTSGKFTIPEDGYIFVTGGNNTDTQIWMTWSDWTSQANGGTWETYTESTVDFSSIMSSYFPYGLLEVGTYQDEINFSSGVATNRVARISYSLANLTNVKAMGVDYEYDENYIYYGLSTPVTNSISVDNSVDAYDHGMEWFTGTTLAVYAQTIYGMNLKNKLERDVLTISQQTLTNSDVIQVKKNLKLNYQSNPNLLDNWYFIGGGSQLGQGIFPINQAGQTTYSYLDVTGFDIPTINRWGSVHVANSWEGEVSLTADGLVLSCSDYTSTKILINQRFPTPKFNELQHKIVTLSILSTNGLSSATFSFGDTGHEVESYIPIGDFHFVSYSATYSCTIAYNHSLTKSEPSPAIKAVKLELGDQQTLAHQENGVWVLNEYPDYEEELLKCKIAIDNSDNYANQTAITNYIASNKNLLSNWFLVGGGSQQGGGQFPYNTLGQTTYTVSGGSIPCIDDWTIQSINSSSTATLTLENDDIYVSGGYILIHALSDQDRIDLLGRQITVSMIKNNNLEAFTITMPDTWGVGQEIRIHTTSEYALLFRRNSNGSIDIRYQSGAAARFKAFKLELGPVQTLAHYQNGAWKVNEIPSTDENAREAQIATVVLHNQAPRAFNAGEYFIYGGLLYRAKTAISQAAQFTLGTNCEIVNNGLAQEVSKKILTKTFSVTFNNNKRADFSAIGFETDMIPGVTYHMVANIAAPNAVLNTGAILAVSCNGDDFTSSSLANAWVRVTSSIALSVGVGVRVFMIPE